MRVIQYSQAEINTLLTKIDGMTQPTKVSDINNDLGFIDNTVNNLVHYYTKTNTYTKDEVNALITAQTSGGFISVNTLPTEDISVHHIYLVPSTNPGTNNIKDEYINLDGTSNGWELIGSTQLDLSNYVSVTALNSALLDYVTSTGLTSILNDYYTKTQVDSLFARYDYSLDEKVVGTWFGKPLYQKTFQTTMPNISSNKYIDIGATVSYVKVVSAETVGSDGWTQPLPTVTASGSGYMRVSVSNNSASSDEKNKIYLENGWGTDTIYDDATTYITLQYTKTTD
jgi:hypothetical protein